MYPEKHDQTMIVTAPDGAQTVFLASFAPPFTVHGLLRDAQGYYRIPYALADATSEGVKQLYTHTAGGRLRFQTDADRIVIRAAMRDITRLSHFSFTGSAGFDLYADNVYRGTFVPPLDLETGYTSELPLGKRAMREITIHFPLYSGVTKLEIGLPAGCTLAKADPYRIPTPVVYYGSSITQGGCASRPGNTYQSMLSRALSCDHLNLGFSGSAKGEPCMADYIAGLSMSAFVLDYDYNAPDPAHLEATHEAFFRTVRRKHPTLPVILLSRPQPNPTGEDLLRRDIVKRTWETAMKAGDRHVCFLDGTQMLHLCGGDCGTVDNCHPNDLGFYCMAKALEPVLKAVLQA